MYFHVLCKQNFFVAATVMLTKNNKFNIENVLMRALFSIFFCADENSTYNTDIYTMVDCDE